MSSGKIVVVGHDTNLVALIQMRLEAAVYEVTGAFVRETARSVYFEHGRYKIHQLGIEPDDHVR